MMMNKMYKLKLALATIAIGGSTLYLKNKYDIIKAKKITKQQLIEDFTLKLYNKINNEAIVQKEEHIHIYGILYYCSMEKLVNLMLYLKERKPFDAIKSKISSFDITQYRNKLIKH